jgi:hypothetical protein
MSFTPTIKLIKVPRTQDSFSIQDTTGTYPDTDSGYGSTGAPASSLAITAVWGAIQNYGDTAVKAVMKSGALASEYIFTTPVKTGVSTLLVWYGEQITAPWTLSSDRSTIIFTEDPGTAISGISGISIDGEYPSDILSVSGATIILGTPLGGSVTSGTTIYRFFLAKLNILIQYNTEKILSARIAGLPLEEDFRYPVIPVIEQFMLKVGAELSFLCCHWSQAHDAACIAEGIVPLSISQAYPL